MIDKDEHAAVAGIVDDIAAGVVKAQATLDSGATATVLDRLISAANDATK
jgi:anthranilate phosphoribosyltransferase